MPGFTKGPSYRTPFGKNVPYRSTRGIRDESYTFSADSFPITMVDGEPTKVLQPGMVIASITSGDNAGKVGVYQGTAGTAEVQTLTEGTAITAGTFVVEIFGVDTDDLDYDITAADLQTALQAAAADAADPTLADLADDIVVTGGTIDTTPFTITFGDSFAVDVPEVTVDVTNLTGTITVATGTAGVEGALDGRELTANLLGINKTFLPTQLLHRDVEISVMYTGSFVQANCYELDADGNLLALTDTVRDAMRSTVSMDLLFF